MTTLEATATGNADPAPALEPVIAEAIAWEWDPFRDRVELPSALLRAAGVSLPDAPALAHVLSLVPAPHHRELRDALGRLLIGAEDEIALEHPVELPDPDVTWALTQARAVRDRDGIVVGVSGTTRNASRRRRAAQQAHLQAQLLDAVEVPVVATDPDGTITHWNRAAERTYGRDRAAAVGRPAAELTSLGPGAPLTDLEGRAAGFVTVSGDAVDRAESERQLRSARDYLRAITDSIAEGLFTVDTEGRLIYVNRAAEQLLGWTRGELAGTVMHDVIHPGAACGGDACRLAGVQREGEMVRAEDKFRRRDGSSLPVEVTCGPFETAEGVRGYVVAFTDVSERKARELRVSREIDALSWVGRVRDALAEERLVLHAQPIVDVATGRTVQHELLIRMVERDGEIVAPGRFLPAAEEFGLIVDIDRWVVRQAVALAARGHAVELNVSAQSLAAPALVDDFRAELRRTGADPALIVVELTETALVDDQDAVEVFIQQIGALGCKVALDDFGTGYGSFSYLKRLPVDFLKIDVEFVRDLAVNEASRHVLAAVVSLARGFGQKTVAEGVEDAEVMDMLHAFGVDYAQGYAIGRPRPVEELLRGTVAAAAAAPPA